MRVEEAMTKEVSFCNPGTNAAAVAEIMWNLDCGILPVLEDSGRLVGMVTDRDLTIALGTQNRPASQLPVADIMHRDPSVCTPDDDVRQALRIMAAQRIHRVPVVDTSGALKGILSMNDVVIRATPGKDGVSKDDVIRALTAICEKPKKSQQATT